MKITKKALKRIIQEEIGRAMSEGGAKPDYVPFEGAEDPAHPDTEEIEAETEKLAQALGISVEDTKKRIEAEKQKLNPLGEQSTLLNEDFGEIIGAVFANLFAEAGFHVATAAMQRDSGGSEGSGGPSAQPRGDFPKIPADPDTSPKMNVQGHTYRDWTKDFYKKAQENTLSPEQLERLKDEAEKSGNAPFQLASRALLDKIETRSKSFGGEKWAAGRAAISPPIPRGIKEMKITKKALKRIIAEEIKEANKKR